MKIYYNILLAAISILLLACKDSPTVKDLETFKATETYPEDHYLDTVKNKKALVILTHDDDDCAMSGTIAKLNKAGWQIEQWTLGNHELAEGRSQHPATIICDGNFLIDGNNQFRKKSRYDSVPGYMPIPKKDFHEVFEMKNFSQVLIEKVEQFAPTVIFTLDNDIGAYGNPDHVFVAQTVYDLFNEGRLSAQRLYQGVYPNSMERSIIEIRLTELSKEWGFENPYMVAKKVYQVDGMPEPDVQVNIRERAEEKMQYLMAYHEKAKKNMRKFIPYYNEFDAATYFSVFDREFFRVINNKHHAPISAAVAPLDK